jgi:hypothetical protein
MSTKVKFKVTYLANLSGRNVVAVEQLNSIDFKAKAGMYLEKIQILGFEIPRFIDVNRKQKSNIYVFWVEESSELELLSIDDIVELSEPNND